MLSLFLHIGILFLSAGAHPRHPKVIPDDRIIGGRPADITEFPYQVSIQYLDIHNCGGSVISPNYILAAGHCFDGITENETLIRAGSSTILEGGVVVKAKKITSHPKYVTINFDGYDMAVVELETPLNYSTKIQPIKLPKSNSSVPNGTVATLTGWGSLQEHSSLMSKQLMTVNLPIISREQCMKDFPLDGINPREICAGAPAGGKDGCLGDSGGPLAVEGVQVGVVSWGRGCGEPNKPGVYSAVAAPENREFIKDVTGL